MTRSMLQIRERLEAQLAARQAMRDARCALPSFRCPDCNRVTYHAVDIERRWCNACKRSFP